METLFFRTDESVLCWVAYFDKDSTENRGLYVF
jgi:hypothetical protein